ncbi:hypothetical protein ACWT_4411 [Actinoplanes sp. SE50]|uniref:hypothetical protein n=1 Tax=unclassified Actinoplanes TaxID=2626549 RepID=UPI00023ECB5D|nr:MULTISPECIES: hypothetical protein [unclassified Actinoplanes]AEV85431.1 hypothetical protein ACPL_4540 [Actinoplanes sp. SE50/110]ATO83826.1 hypothetical protein ACWT_4411 [Actinoplanes sp. SE50]SLM01234.1 hypothetical protein ACSP50_4470 [Actinoplanes sp. SE50/110]
MSPDSPASTSPHSKLRLYLVALAVVLVAASAAAVMFIVRDGSGLKVRYEVEATSKTATMITWTNGTSSEISKVPASLGETAGLPWSTTVTFKKSQQYVAVAVTLSEPGNATCRMFFDGEKVAETTNPGGVICEGTTP